MEQYYSRFKEEEKIINELLDKNPDEYQGTYVDIGANQPVKNSNTYYYYIRGWKGLLIEANPRWAKSIKEIRSKDILLQAAIMDYSGVVEMRYDRVLGNSIDKIHKGKHQQNIYTVKCITINNVIKQYPQFAEPDFVSIDIEGSEENMLSKCNFEIFKPKVICIEYMLKKHDFRKKWEHFILPHYELKKVGRVDLFYLRKK